MPTPIQASGYFDSRTDEYSFTLCSGDLVVTFDFLSKEDIKHLHSCLECLLLSEEPPDNG
jgi:hypothetical protein